MCKFDEIIISKEPRAGCKDLWNAHMVEGAIFSEHDIPLCPTFLPNGLPKALISYEKAKTIFKAEVEKGINYHDAFIHFCIDDQKFDSVTDGIWYYPEKFLKIAKHFAGIITPDFSTCLDFPDPIKRNNTYRMRAFGYWCYSQGIPTINNVRWGCEDTWEYCFDGIPSNSVVFIGTIASGIRQKAYREIFVKGIRQLAEILSPKVYIIYGSQRDPVFDELRKAGAEIIHFESETNQFFKSRR